jgi:hypothetical protein
MNLVRASNQRLAVRATEARCARPDIMRPERADAVGLRPLKLFVGGVRERLVVAHRGRGKTVSARVARPALLCGSSTSPLEVTRSRGRLCRC